MNNFVYNMRLNIILLLLVLSGASKTYACISQLLNWRAQPAVQIPVPVAVPVLKVEQKTTRTGLGYLNTLVKRAQKFDYATAKQSTVQALKSAGNFIKTTAQAHPYRTATVCAGVAAGSYLWYQHGKHARLVKKLKAEKVYLLKHGLQVPEKLENDLKLAEQNLKIVEAETFNKHWSRLPRPAILIPALIGGSCAIAIGIDIAKTLKLTEALSASRFLLPNHTISLLPNQPGSPASFAGYRAIFKFARQQYFKPSDIVKKTCFGAGASSLFLTSCWIALRNKAAKTSFRR